MLMKPKLLVVDDDHSVREKSDHLVPIRHVVRHGVPKYEILRLAESMDVDLIILSEPV